ncbi:hypothetical protein M8C21_028274 [Ambrosia artemisiifolia]|uniref:Uncharacterized protein n=1 Tax=Ambrosia artemisiifolia TaxID=4212 RepID=A0AAD5GYV4_AMBAR|nr:hypothetical protein M8C21_028274 [Ambrosia artemisiifolia]
MQGRQRRHMSCQPPHPSYPLLSG